MPRAKKADATTTPVPIVAYKGFNDDWTCRPEGKVFQYEVGKTYTHDGEVKACKSGFHACEHPLDVLSYYAPATSRFAMVTLGGATAKKGGDTKIAAAEGVKETKDRGAATASGDWGAATASGSGGAATASGSGGAATASGSGGAATASGYEGKARGKAGCALFLVERNSDGEIIHVWAGIAGKDDIKPDIFYTLRGGKPVETE